MAIRAFTGIPGAGKTYRVVHDLVQKDVLEKYYIVHNIDSLRTDLIQGSELIKSIVPDSLNSLDLTISFNQFFSKDYQTEFTKAIQERYNRPVLYIIDEAQVQLNKLDAKILEFLSYHRHLGCDVWLVTQNIFSLAREYQNLVEVEIRGNRGYIFRGFSYSWLVRGVQFKVDKLKTDKTIFTYYQSFQYSEPKQKRSKILYIGAGLIAFGILMGLFSLWKFGNLFNSGKSVKAPSVARSSTAPTVSNKLKSPDDGFYYVGQFNGKHYIASGSRLEDVSFVFPNATYYKVNDRLVVVEPRNGVLVFERPPVSSKYLPVNISCR